MSIDSEDNAAVENSLEVIVVYLNNMADANSILFKYENGHFSQILWLDKMSSPLVGNAL